MLVLQAEPHQSCEEALVVVTNLLPPSVAWGYTTINFIRSESMAIFKGWLDDSRRGQIWTVGGYLGADHRGSILIRFGRWHSPTTRCRIFT